MRQLSVLVLCFSLLVSCSFRQQKVNEGIGETGFKYARNIIMEHKDGYVVVKLLNPWKKGTILQTYYLMPRNAESENISDGVRVDVPIQRSVVFTSAHANRLEMLHAGKSISGVADLKYMLIPDIQRRAHSKGGIVNCGDAMKPDVEQIIDLKPEAILLSPFENSGGYGRLGEIGIPVFKCVGFLGGGALGGGEWGEVFGLLY